MVYLAEDERLKRKVALKILPPDLAEDTEFRERFIRESQMAAALDHPNIVPIFEANEEDGLLYITMRYIPGSDLKDVVSSEGPLVPARVCALLEQVAGALDDAHDRDLVHRDVKPQNILVQRRAGRRAVEHAFLTDFGLTKRRDSRTLTQRGMIVGTIDYMSPEQLTAGDVDSRTDIYALGCVLFECLTGSVPYDRATDIAAVSAALNDPVPEITRVRSDLPRGLDGVIARALAKSPDDRYSSCLELVEDAQRTLGVSADATGTSEDRTVIAPGPSDATLVAPPREVAETRAGSVPPVTPEPPGAAPPVDHAAAGGTVVGPGTQVTPLGPAPAPPMTPPVPLPRPAKESISEKRRVSPLLIVLLLLLVTGGVGAFLFFTSQDGGDDGGRAGAVDCTAPPASDEDLACLLEQDFGDFEFSTFSDPAHTDADFEGFDSAAVYNGPQDEQVTVEVIFLRDAANVPKKQGDVRSDFEERFDTVVSDQPLTNEAGDEIGQITVFRDTQEAREALLWTNGNLVGDIEGIGFEDGEVLDFFRLLPPEATSDAG